MMLNTPLLLIILHVTCQQPLPVPPLPLELDKTLLVDAVLIDRLIEALSDSDTDVRQNLATALTKFGVGAVPKLTITLKDTNAERRAGAAYTLGQIGMPAKSAIPILLDLLKDDNLEVRRQASYALSRLVIASRDNRIENTLNIEKNDSAFTFQRK